MIGSYPNTRLRGARAHACSRAMHRETALAPADLIWPLFVTSGNGVEEPIGSLPGVSRWSVPRMPVYQPRYIYFAKHVQGCKMLETIILQCILRKYILVFFPITAKIFFK